MKNLQTPPFLNNLYRDMRDRRLLLPALALIVGLIAVPIVLSRSAATTAPPPPPAAAGSGAGHEAVTSPAVLTEQLGVTNYRKRLERLKSKNPFRLHFVSRDQGAAAGASSSAASTTPSTAGTAGSSTSIPPAVPTSSTSETPSTSPSGAPSSTHASKRQKPSQPTAYGFRIDVAFGAPGEVTRRKGVEQGALLPRETKPIAAFVGASENMKKALFLVSDDVSSVGGDGRCLPGRNDCQLLKLEVGGEAKLAYAPEGDRTYRLKLLAIDLAPLEANAGAG